MSRVKFLDFLRDNIVLFDGAMGTSIYARGIYINRCYDELNLSKPDLVKEIHLGYVQAGADVIETNTFGANRFKLSAYGYNEELYAINFRGAHIAREVAGENLWIAGSVGPLGIRIEPWGPTSEGEAEEAFGDQIKALADGGVDLIILETFSDLNEIHQAIKAVRRVCSLPVIAQMTIDENGNTSYGTPIEQVAQQLTKFEPDIVGLNCGVGPHMMLSSLERMIPMTDLPISIQPNAGFPKKIENRAIYLSSAEYMAEYARRFIQAGAKIVGGCCGTTPEYIQAMRSAIQSLIPGRKGHRIDIKPATIPGVNPVPIEQKSKFATKLASREFVTSVELVPPRGIEVSAAISATRILREVKVDSVNIPEGPRALSRMGATYLSKIILDEVGIEPIVHYTCRDRNLLGIISDLLGIHALGLRNLLLITGDPPKMGDLPNATAVFDIDSIGLVNVVNRLNHGIDLGGNPIGRPTEYLIGVGVNPGAIDLDNELRRFEWKVKAGAEFAITQPVFDVDILFSFLERIRPFGIPIVAGIWPLVSLRNAEFMNNEIPGTHVPDEILKRMASAQTRESALNTGLEIARETIQQIFPSVNGVQISMPFGKIDTVLKVLDILPALKSVNNSITDVK
ncbi:MAG: bifunctional homocysteine S-methyltransferase/methylenetetrahydrofolate reductase [Candidatus Marinimicrobia bacterium CG08_land_8_20_14_0_20_45_22]|nr:MAG: bifunctional homocysteine S-methyltransferase/methylenetetrahydrofolate reductase [Candidatus Marinimicrobia bacterium CG08_land_8_20_14_0_20_45_22]